MAAGLSKVSALSAGMRDEALASAAQTTSRRDRLLGLNSGSNIAGGLGAFADSEDSIEELTEQDLWDAETRRSKEDEEARKDSLWIVKIRPDGSDSRKLLTNGRRWYALDKDQNGDAMFPRGLSSLSPLNRPQVNQSSPSREGSAVRIQTPSRLIHQVGAHHSDTGRQIMQQSAPVNIANWSKIAGAGSENKRMNHKLPDLGAEDEEEDEEEEERLPPHELVAREYAKSHFTTSSVFEGVGRTLKGRDLSRVRNAVLRQTGFLDS
ncbi:hypothetical protein O6H91_04G069100 [Diphasiastrum complanatum]|uniref:Uncharacterized protein n=1 Tax=Diphasiastrum complanatum TaxID=34168 RepID=A0ACC2DXR0_DIPCM|nr:hypothetical protein O6H91_04G069100 [Diphasiastrum complanatum]